MPCGGIYYIEGTSAHDCMECEKPDTDLWVEEWAGFIHSRCLEKYMATPEYDCIIAHDHAVEVDRKYTGLRADVARWYLWHAKRATRPRLNLPGCLNIKGAEGLQCDTAFGACACGMTHSMTNLLERLSTAAYDVRWDRLLRTWTLELRPLYVGTEPVILNWRAVNGFDFANPCVGRFQNMLCALLTDNEERWYRMDEPEGAWVPTDVNYFELPKAQAPSGYKRPSRHLTDRRVPSPTKKE